MLTPDEILKILEERCDFPYPDSDNSSLITDENYEIKIIEPLQDAFDESWDYASGATKLVLIFKSLPFVVKIPFMANSDSGYPYATQTVRTSVREIKNTSSLTSSDFRTTYIYNSNPTLFFNSKAPMGSLSWDYCALEVAIYQKALEWGIEKLFAREVCIGDIHGYPIYIQDKAIDFSEGFDEKTTVSPSEAYDIVNDTMMTADCTISADWCANVVEKWGKDTFQKLISFIEEMNINDIHNANIGYIDGKPVLIDYSGYYN